MIFKYLMIILFPIFIFSQQIEGSLEFLSNKTLGFGSDLSIPLVYKGISQLVLGNRIYTTSLDRKEKEFLRRSTWNLGHRLQYQRDIYTSALSFYSGIEYWISQNILNEYDIRQNIKPLVFLEYTFKRGTFFPQNRKSFKVFIGGSPDEYRFGLKVVLDLRNKYIAYYK